MEDKMENKEEERTYKIRVKCANCGEAIIYTIPFGTTTKVFFNERKDTKCLNCGCKIMKEIEV